MLPPSAPPPAWRVTFDGALGRALCGARAGLGRARRVLRAVVGAPDYEGYLAHCRARGAPALDRAAFERDRQAARYDRPGARCC